ncbi:MAG: type II toxin-antitoxin system VapC family toxin, partial [Nitrospirota bacterium]|nr:type II toxin-antitoxin system VapC family toxin [Nitrospirota bacterium]
DKYAKYVKTPSRIVTPTIVLYEVYKKVRREKTEEEALIAVSLMNRTSIIPLRESIALFAADLSIKYSLPMADAIVYATAIEENCRVVTSDAHFRELENVLFIT